MLSFSILFIRYSSLFPSLSISISRSSFSSISFHFAFFLYNSIRISHNSLFGFFCAKKANEWKRERKKSNEKKLVAGNFTWRNEPNEPRKCRRLDDDDNPNGQIEGREANDERSWRCCLNRFTAGRSKLMEMIFHRRSFLYLFLFLWTAKETKHSPFFFLNISPMTRCRLCCHFATVDFIVTCNGSSSSSRRILMAVRIASTETIRPLCDILINDLVA